jgi:hypothetical protein
MAKLSDEQRRVLRLLTRHPHGCAEAVLLEQGFSYDQLGVLVFDGLATMQPSVAHNDGRERFLSGLESPRQGGRRSPNEKPPVSAPTDATMADVCPRVRGHSYVNGRSGGSMRLLR